MFEAFLKFKQETFREFSYSSERKKTFKCLRVMLRTVQLLRHDAYCPITLS